MLGPPDSFWCRIGPGDYREAAGVAGGFLTRSAGSIPSAWRRSSTARLAEWSIARRWGTEVQDIARRGRGFAIATRRDGVLETVSADLVVIAANHWGFALAARIADAGYRMPTVYAALREIVLVDRSGTGYDATATNFMLEGEDGAMEGGVTPALSFVYCPRYSQIAKIRLDPRSPRVPADWEERMRRPCPEGLERGRQILQGAARASYGYLDGDAGLHPCQGGHQCRRILPPAQEPRVSTSPRPAASTPPSSPRRRPPR